MNDILIMFQEWKSKNPETYRQEITSYLEKLRELLNEENSVFYISVLSAFRDHPEWQEECLEIYKSFGKSNFIVKKLEDEDIKQIIIYYVQKNEQYGKEVLHV